MQNDFPISEQYFVSHRPREIRRRLGEEDGSLHDGARDRNKKWSPQPTSLVQKQVPEIPGKKGPRLKHLWSLETLVGIR
jgi:hypothetical protein